MSNELRDAIAQALYVHLHKPAKRLEGKVDTMLWEDATVGSREYFYGQADAVLAAPALLAAAAAAAEREANHG